MSVRAGGASVQNLSLHQLLRQGLLQGPHLPPSLLKATQSLPGQCLEGGREGGAACIPGAVVRTSPLSPALPSPCRSLWKHFRGVTMCLFLLLFPGFMAYRIAHFFHMDFWLLILVSSCMLTSLQVPPSGSSRTHSCIPNGGSEEWAREQRRNCSAPAAPASEVGGRENRRLRQEQVPFRKSELLSTGSGLGLRGWHPWVQGVRSEPLSGIPEDLGRGRGERMGSLFSGKGEKEELGFLRPPGQLGVDPWEGRGATQSADCLQTFRKEGGDCQEPVWPSQEQGRGCVLR